MDKVRLGQKDFEKFIHNQILFFRAPLLVYLGIVMVTISQSGHAISLHDFAVTNGVITAFGTYIVGAVIDYLQKLKG